MFDAMRCLIAGVVAIGMAQAQAPPAQMQRRVEAIETRVKDLNTVMAGVDTGTDGPASLPLAILSNGGAQDPEVVAKLERLFQTEVDKALRNMPLCSGRHAALERNIAAVDHLAHWTAENRPAPKDALADADRLDQSVKEFEGRVQDLSKALPELRAARTRLGSPLPSACDSSERDFETALEGIRQQIRILRSSTAQ